MNFERNESEGEFHVIWKVYSHFDKGGKIVDTQKAGQICNELLKVDYDESRHRKLYEGFVKVWNEVRTEYVSEESLLEQFDDMDAKQDELYKQQVKTRDWTREKRKLLRDEGRIEHMLESFKSSYANAEETLIDKYDKKLEGDLSAILLLSDFHVGIEIQNYWNTYNQEVFKERLNTVAYKVMKYADKMNIGTLYVASLGDLISGSIHATTRLAEEMDTLDQVMFVAKAMKNLLFELSSFGLDIKYLSVIGNHDRLNKVWKENIEKESFNKIVDWYIKDKVDDGILDIEFIANEIDAGIGHFVIDGKDCFMVHGHQDNINNVVGNLTSATGIIPKFVVMGHYHNKNTYSKNNTKVFINGSLVGVDEFAKDKRYFTDPTQSLIILDGDDILDIELKL